MMNLPPAPETDLEARLRAYYRQRHTARPDSETLWARLAPQMQGPASAFPQADSQREPRLNARPLPRPPRRVFSWVAALAAVLVIALITTALVASHHTGTGTPTASPTAQGNQQAAPSGVYFNTYSYPIPPSFDDVPPTTLYALNPADGAVKWHFDGGVHSTGGSSALEGGVLYTIISNSKQETSDVYAFDVRDGTVRWHHALGDYVEGRLMVENRVIYVASRGSTSTAAGSPGGTAFALNASDGSLRWHRQLQGQLSLAQVVNGVAYIESSIGHPHGSTGMAYALNASDGSVRWSVALVGSPAIKVIGNLVTMMEMGQTDGATESSVIIHSVFEVRNASDGSLQWSYPGNTVKLHGVLVTQDTVYADISNPQDEYPTRVEALDTSTGALRWRAPIANTNVSMASVMDGTLYVNTGNPQDNSGALYALDTSSGAVRWHVDGGAAGSGAWPDNGVVYNPTSSGISSLNKSNGALQWHYQTPGQENYISAVVNDVMYVLSISIAGSDLQSLKGTVLALNASNGKLLWQYHLNVGISYPLVK
jgi:outer membrane protein assembly factor BamB